MVERGQKQILDGVVVSDRMEKTVRVEVKRRVLHPVYKKYIIKKKKYSADTGQHECNNGDKVKILSVRPMSKTKRWRVTEIVEKGRTS